MPLPHTFIPRLLQQPLAEVMMDLAANAMMAEAMIAAVRGIVMYVHLRKGIGRAKSALLRRGFESDALEDKTKELIKFAFLGNLTIIIWQILSKKFFLL